MLAVLINGWGVEFGKCVTCNICIYTCIYMRSLVSTTLPCDWDHDV